MGVFIRSNEVPGRTNCNAKNLRSLCCTVAKNQEKTPKMAIAWKMGILWGFSWIFQQQYISKSLSFFAMWSVLSGSSFELSNSPHMMIFLAYK